LSPPDPTTDFPEFFPYSSLLCLFLPLIDNQFQACKYCLLTIPKVLSLASNSGFEHQTLYLTASLIALFDLNLNKTCSSLSLLILGNYCLIGVHIRNTGVILGLFSFNP
jgi:hypothetical protein